MADIAHCPALLISAPASGQGKTTLVAALARYHRNRGKNVRVFKTGPDFLDPKIHEQASGAPVHQLDLWMVGKQQCKQMLYEAAVEADLILVEGVMGLFDGDPSSADLAEFFDLPVAALIDAGAMAQTFGAVAQGLATYRRQLDFAGVFANRVASEGHCHMLKESLPDHVAWLGHLPRDAAITLPERHLGLHQPDTIADLDDRLNAAAALIADTPLAELPAPVAFHPGQVAAPPPLLRGIRIAVARDNAFSFVYPANLEVLRAMGADLLFFSPLTDPTLPEADCLYLPGGYPELHLDTLANNEPMLSAIRAHHQAGKAIVAECGGMLYLLESLADSAGNRRHLAGVIPAAAAMQKKLGGLGAQGATFAAGELRGHTFHYSRFESEPAFALRALRHPRGGNGEGVYRNGSLTASYVHWYLPSNPSAAAALFRGTPS
ncbi:MAG: cobyrinate a,c-diamide synthase [Porticoccaceae bacterium]|nr:cobyrinate a,c-diamide synthase [Porticoccaceae bacterium]